MHRVITHRNIVATVNLDCKLDLKTIAFHARNVEYNPKVRQAYPSERARRRRDDATTRRRASLVTTDAGDYCFFSTQRFAAAIMRIRNPKTTALIFSSGKMVCTGAKTEALAREAARKYAKVIIKLGFPAQFKDFKIQNMVGSCDVQFPIRLEGLAWQHGHFAQYEPELFPGLIYRMQMPKIVLLIFVSGKIVLTGGKRREDIIRRSRTFTPCSLSLKSSLNRRRPPPTRPRRSRVPEPRAGKSERRVQPLDHRGATSDDAERRERERRRRRPSRRLSSRSLARRARPPPARPPPPTPHRSPSAGRNTPPTTARERTSPPPPPTIDVSTRTESNRTESNDLLRPRAARVPTTTPQTHTHTNIT